MILLLFAAEVLLIIGYEAFVDDQITKRPQKNTYGICLNYSIVQHCFLLNGASSLPQQLN